MQGRVTYVRENLEPFGSPLDSMLCYISVTKVFNLSWSLGVKQPFLAVRTQRYFAVSISNLVQSDGVQGIITKVGSKGLDIKVNYVKIKS